MPDPKQHHDLFQRGVAGALADAVDRAFDATRARAEGGERVGGGQPEVVVAVDREEDLVSASGVGDQPVHEFPELSGQAVAGRVRDVDDGRPSRDHRLDGLQEVLRVCAAGVLRRVLHPLAQRARVGDHLGALLEHLFTRHAQLALDVHV